MMEKMREILEQMRRRSVFGEEDPIGCTESEMNTIQELAGGSLPAAYVEFMRFAGKNAGSFLQGTDFVYPRVLQLREWASELLDECDVHYAIPGLMFVFSMHQGYEFLSFMLGSGDDPAVFQYVEGEAAPAVQWPSFSSYILDMFEKKHNVC